LTGRRLMRVPDLVFGHFDLRSQGCPVSPPFVKPARPGSVRCRSF
jgi:hypothetical protein